MIKLRLLISVLVIGIGSVASAGHLVTNGGFEVSGFSGWTGSAVSDSINNFVGGMSAVGIMPNEGSKQAYFGNTSPEVISQSLSTTVNGSETIAFALADIAGSNTDYVKVYFGGTPTASTVVGGTLLATISNTGSGYKTYSYNATATSSSTILSFLITNPGGGWALDAISVTETNGGGIAVPEPSTFVLACVACVTVLARTLFRRRKEKLGEVIA
ncbi:MAG: hypothetical protein WCH39_28735 [Schlesneria sp.]